MERATPPGIHLPEPSFWPIALAFSVTLMAVGVLATWIISLIGVIGLIGSLIGWALENRADEHGSGSHG